MRRDGKHSGEEFRDDILLPKFEEVVKANGRLIVVLDGTKGYASSFLEEAFGGLVRARNNQQEVKDHLEIESKERPWYESEVEEYIAEAI